MIYFLPILIFGLDWLTKYCAITYLQPHAPFVLTPFFNLYLTFNSGVSFSLFRAENTFGVWMLIFIACVICGFLLHAFKREKNKWIRVALLAILGGALGNIWDRLRYGVVIDFLDFHLADYHWPAFNIADSAICIGVVVILYQTLRRRK